MLFTVRYHIVYPRLRGAINTCKHTMSRVHLSAKNEMYMADRKPQTTIQLGTYSHVASILVTTDITIHSVVLYP